MTTYFHVAPADFQTGSDLFCWDELEASGYDLTWKYAGEPVDTDVVCLFRTEAEARDFVATFLPTGKILRVTIPTHTENVRMTLVQEGYPAVVRMIPAEYISELK